MSKKYTIAVDFDGTLCDYGFPKIGTQTEEQKSLIKFLKKARLSGHKLILYTCRGDKEGLPVLTEAIEWCKEQGLEFDSVNENIPSFKKLSGYSPKPVADFYLDDKAVNVKNWRDLNDYI